MLLIDSSAMFHLIILVYSATLVNLTFMIDFVEGEGNVEVVPFMRSSFCLCLLGFCMCGSRGLRRVIDRIFELLLFGLCSTSIQRFSPSAYSGHLGISLLIILPIGLILVPMISN